MEKQTMQERGVWVEVREFVQDHRRVSMLMHYAAVSGAELEQITNPDQKAMYHIFGRKVGIIFVGMGLTPGPNGAVGKFQFPLQAATLAEAFAKYDDAMQEWVQKQSSRIEVAHDIPKGKGIRLA